MFQKGVTFATIFVELKCERPHGQCPYKNFYRRGYIYIYGAPVSLTSITTKSRGGTKIYILKVCALWSYYI